MVCTDDVKLTDVAHIGTCEVPAVANPIEAETADNGPISSSCSYEFSLHRDMPIVPLCEEEEEEDEFEYFDDEDDEDDELDEEDEFEEDEFDDEEEEDEEEEDEDF